MNYGEMIAEVTQRTGDAGLPNRAAMFTRQAETELSQRFKQPEYDAIPSLLTTDTNWLLSSNEEIYMTAVLKKYYVHTLDVEKAQAASVLLSDLISDKHRDDRVLRYLDTKPAIGSPAP